MGRQEELKAKNTPIDGAHYTFKLDEVDLVYAPDGWDDDEFTLQRDMIRFGVFRKFSSLELKFVKDGRDYLSSAYELGGVNTETKITVTETDTMNVTRVRFIGYIDYSTYKITELSVDVQVIDGSFTDLLLSRMNSTVNLLGTKTIDGDAIAAATTQSITLPEINIYKVGEWRLDRPNPTHTEDHSIETVVWYTEFTEDAATIGDYFAFFDNAVNAATGATLAIIINGIIDAVPDSSVFAWVFHLDRYNGGVISESDVWQKVVAGDTNNFPQTLAINETATFDISEGDSFVLWAEIQNDSGAGSVHYSDVNLKLTTLTNSFAQKSLTSFLYHEAFDRAIALTTGLTARFKSDLLGRTDLGYSADGIIGAILSGYYLRNNSGGLSSQIAITISDLYDSIRAIYCAGLGIETIGGVEKAVIEPMAYFFSDAIVLDVSNRIAPETITKEYYPELAYNRIVCGYKSYDYDLIGGVYEFNTANKYTTVIKPVDKQLDILSSYRADMSLVLKVLSTPQGTDASGESDIIILDTIRDGVNYKVRTSEGFDSFNSHGNASVLFNLDITPARNIRRWGEYLRGFLEKYTASELIWQSSDKNTTLESTETGQSTILENSDILVSGLADPLWLPEIVQFEVPALDTDIVVIEENKYGLIKYTSTDYGWILTYKAKNENGKCEFTLLRCNTDYVIPGGTPPVYPSSLNVNVIITDLPSDNFTFTLLIISGGVLFLSQLISQDNPFELTHLPYGSYDIYLYVTDTGYELTTVLPVTITISADNLHEVVDIVVYKIPTTGTVTVTKLITGVTEDETYFDITITGTDGEMVEQFDQVRLGEPLTFYDLPFGTYEITEAATDGYTLSSITPSTVVLSAGNASEEVEIVNDVVSTGLEFTFKIVSEVIQWPTGITDPSDVSEWNTLLSMEFAAVTVIGNMVRFSGSNDAYTTLFITNTSLIKVENINSHINHVDCSFNEITDLLALPLDLQYLDCSYNYLTTEKLDSILTEFLTNPFPSLAYVYLSQWSTTPPTPSVKDAFIAAYPTVTISTD